jgi:hypothetical protein
MDYLVKPAPDEALKILAVLNNSDFHFFCFKPSKGVISSRNHFEREGREVVAKPANIFSIDADRE